MVFKSEPVPFDRAGIIDDVNDVIINKDENDRKVIEKAFDFYEKEYYKILKEIDPVYDSESFEYKYASNQKKYEDLKEIERGIKEGKSIDGFRDLIPKIKNSTEEYFKNVQIIKNGSAIQVIEKIGPDNIRKMNKAEEIIEEFNLKLKDIKISFDEIYENFKEVLSLYNKENVDFKESQILHNLENDLVISTLAKIIKENGGKNESIEKSANKFDEYLRMLVNKEIFLKNDKGIVKEENKKEISEIQEEKQKSEEVKIIKDVKNEKSIEDIINNEPIVEKDKLEIKTTPIGIESIKEESSKKEYYNENLFKSISDSYNIKELKLEKDKLDKKYDKENKVSFINELKSERTGDVKKNKEESLFGTEFFKSVFGDYYVEKDFESKEYDKENKVNFINELKSERTDNVKKNKEESSFESEFLKSIFGDYYKDFESKRYNKENIRELKSEKDKLDNVKEFIEKDSFKSKDNENNKFKSVEELNLKNVKSNKEIKDSFFIKNTEDIILNNDKKTSEIEIKKEIDTIKETASQKLNNDIKEINLEEKRRNEQDFLKPKEEVKNIIEKEVIFKPEDKILEKGERIDNEKEKLNNEKEKFISTFLETFNEKLTPKLDSIIMLLSQLNETIQNPLLTIDVNKKFE